MSRPEVRLPWYASPYTGLFSRCGPVPPRPHDPAVCAWSGTIPRWGLDGTDLVTGGAGWDEAGAEAAGVGEAVERWQCRPVPQDRVLQVSFADWPLEQPAVEPERWVFFHTEQYARDGFPFVPLTRATVCGWVCCREAESGLPWWVPESLVFLEPQAKTHLLGPSISTGLSCGRAGDPVLLRGLQEVIERDALVGAWWGAYALEEHDPERAFREAALDVARLLRPNLRYRCYRIDTPLGGHVTLVTLEGEDREGYCFSVGSACRETRGASWAKSFLEAVQGRHYVRYLKGRLREAGLTVEVPVDFAGHAVYYSLHPEALKDTPLHRAGPGSAGGEATEGFAELRERLGRPVLFRHLTPPALLTEGLDWVVLRVLVPGLQPLHGHHGYPFLGGLLWRPRGTAEWRRMPPHPFP
jgi:ribosomal protein S12 methylthiotransferase accessory factor